MIGASILCQIVSENTHLDNLDQTQNRQSTNRTPLVHSKLVLELS